MKFHDIIIAIIIMKVLVHDGDHNYVLIESLCADIDIERYVPTRAVQCTCTLFNLAIGCYHEPF